MQEDFLHFLWRTQRFDIRQLYTTQGELIEIQQKGTHNHHAGPDFSNARIRIGDTLWAGNVEIHLKASDWYRHRHEEDPAYQNVILHVVLEEDRPVLLASGERIPCLEIQRLIPPRLLQLYRKLQHNENWIPCQHLLYQAPEVTRQLWLDRLTAERLENRTLEMAQTLDRQVSDWEEIAYYYLARSFGLQVNTEAFMQLARATPLRLLSKHKQRLFQIEALLFGQAGMLDQNFKSDYPQRLKKEYTFLKTKYQLRPIPVASWKFMRLRPANFPTIRIAQLATLIYQSTHLFDKMLAARSVKEIEQMLQLSLSNYWQTHYVFEKPSAKRKKALGKKTIHLIIINTIAPLLFLYGIRKDDLQFKERALALLEQLPPEQNKVIDNWKKLGFQPQSAYQSQALLELKKNYCNAHRCMNCAIGNTILK